MLAIIHNVSHWVPLGVTKCIHGFDCLFLWFSRRVLKWQCILYMRMNSHSHMLKMFFQILSSCVVDHFSRGLMRSVEGFQCIDGLFRVSPPRLVSETGKFVSCWSWTVNKCSQIWNVHLHFFFFLMKQKQNRKSTFLQFLFGLYHFFYFTENRRFTNALYIKYLYVFVKQAYDTFGFL